MFAASLPFPLSLPFSFPCPCARLFHPLCYACTSIVCGGAFLVLSCPTAKPKVVASSGIPCSPLFLLYLLSFSFVLSFSFARSKIHMPVPPAKILFRGLLLLHLAQCCYSSVVLHYSAFHLVVRLRSLLARTPSPVARAGGILQKALVHD